MVFSLLSCPNLCPHDLDLGFQISKELEELELNALRASYEDPPAADGADPDGDGDENDEKASIIMCSTYVQSRMMYVIARTSYVHTFFFLFVLCVVVSDR